MQILDNKLPMTERYYRLVLGAVILTILYFDLSDGMLLLVAVLLFEGVTNWRIPLMLTSRVNTEEDEKIITERTYGEPVTGKIVTARTDGTETSGNKVFRFEAERAMPIVVLAILVPTYFLFYDTVWAVSWLLGFALIAAGLIGFCPIVKVLRSVGFS